MAKIYALLIFISYLFAEWLNMSILRLTDTTSHPIPVFSFTGIVSAFYF